MKKKLSKLFLFIGLFGMTFVVNSSSINSTESIQTDNEFVKTDEFQTNGRLGVHWKGLGGCRFNGEGCTVVICSGGSLCFHYWN